MVWLRKLCSPPALVVAFQLLLPVVAVLLALARPCETEAAPLKYRWPAGSEFAYAFKVETDLGSQVEVVEGTSVFRPSVAGDTATGDDAAQGTGSGFVVHSSGYLVTCAHVVEGATRIQVKLAERTYDGRVVTMDKVRDLAVVRVKAQNLPVVPLGDSDQIQLAEQVQAVGFPLSTVLGSSIKISTGSIAGIVERDEGKLLQLDAGINPGNSGGPVVNAFGQVVGVASAKLAGEEISNVGFAVPAADVQKMLKKEGVSFGTDRADARLAGPDLAKRVTPAVAMLTVTIGPGGVGAAERFVLGVRGNMETYTKRKSGSKRPSRSREREIRDGKVIADVLGQVFDATGVPHLPFGLGSAGTVGIEQLPDGDESRWTFEDVIAITQSLSDSKDGGAGPAIVLPAAVRIAYSRGQPLSDGIIPITKNYTIITLGKQNGRPLLHVSGSGIVNFDPRAGMPRDMTFKGKIELTVDNRTLQVPVSYSYRKVDPKTAGGRAVASRGSSDGSVGRVGRGSQAAEREAVPSTEDRKKAESQVNEIFTSELAGARTSAHKLALAEKFFQFASEEKNPVNQFVLFDMARRQAIAAGELGLAIRAADRLASRYVVDASRLEMSTLVSVSKTASSTSQQAQVAALANQLMEETAEAEQFDIAFKFGAMALTAARKGERSDLVRQLTRRGRELAAIRSAHAKVKDALEALQKSPADADANMDVGKYYCFARSDWDRGIPMLAIGSDPQLKAAAKQDLAAPTDASQQVAVADAWWELAEAALDDSEKNAMRGRAVVWYRKALPALAGLDRVRVMKRVPATPEPGEAIASTDDPRTRPTSSGEKQLSAVAMRNLLIERVADRVQHDEMLRSGEVGFTLGKQAFSSLPREGGLLVGLDLSIGQFNHITAIRPIYHTAKGQVAGNFIGSPTRATRRLLANKGFAVSSITVKGGIGITGIGLTFMEIQSDGLNSEKRYNSPWVGGRGGEKTLGGDGMPIVGLIGHRESSKIMALGVIQADASD